MKHIPQSHADILGKPAFAHLSTLMPDGSPQASAVWVDTDGAMIVVNSAEGRLKDKNIRRDPRVAISVTDPENPYRSLMIRGRVAKITNEGADKHIDRMAKKYMGVDQYPFRQPGEVRVLYYIQPERVSAMG
ncbi:MAG: PPOX class F420-dependent oxidoreductase [Polyangiales bacterium]